jgi:hypothetical protein
MDGGEVPDLLTQPICVCWATDDVFSINCSWRDCLTEFFSYLHAGKFMRVEHFPHRDDTETASRNIGSFFDALEEKTWQS